MAERYTRRINLYINDKEVRNDIASIRKEMMKAQKAQNRMIIGSKQYVAEGKKIAMLRGIMNKHNADLKKTQASWFSLGRMADKANKYMSAAMAATAALMGVILGLRTAAKAAMDFEERLDSLSALTGLEGRQLQWLGDTAKQTSIDITDTGVRIKQAATDIVDAYTKVGSQRPELLKNKEALHQVTKNAIILSEAAKSKLEPAVKGLTMAMNQHNLGASQTERIINAMAAGSKLGAANIPYLTAVIEKSGTTMNLMNLSLEDNIALTEAIAPSFSEAAAAGTSLDRTFLKMKAQGIGYKDGVFDIMAALTELRHRFDKGEMAVDLFGLRHAKMAEILVKNRSEFQRYREGIDGTSIAFEQAQKNTDNTATKLAQAKNRMTLVLIEFGEKISPIFLKSTKVMRYMIKGLVELPNFIKANQILLLSLASAVMVYNAALIVAIATNIKLIAVSKAKMLADLAANIAFRAQFASIALYNSLVAVMTGSLKVAAIQMRAFSAALMLNPIGAVIGAFGALIIAIKSYDKYSEASRRADANKASAVQGLITINEGFRELIEKTNKSIDKSNTLSRYRKILLAEEVKEIISVTEAQIRFQKEKQKDILIENTRASLWQKSINILKAGGNPMIAASLNAIDAANNGAEAAKIMEDGLQGLSDSLDASKQNDTSLYEILNAEGIGDEIGIATLVELEEKLGQYQLAQKNLLIGSKEYIRVLGKVAEVEQLITDAREKGAITTEEQRKKELQAAKNALKLKIDNATAEYNIDVSFTKKRFLEKRINEDEYNAELLTLQHYFIQEKLRIYKKGSKEYAKAYNESLSLHVETNKKMKELLLKAEEELQKANIDNLQDGLYKEEALEIQRYETQKDALEKRLIDKEYLSDMEVALNEKIHTILEENEIAHQTKIQAIRDAHNLTELENFVDAAEPIDENTIELEKLQGFHDAKQDLIQAQYEAEKEMAAGNQSALLAAENRFNRKTLQNKTQLIEAEYAITKNKISNAQMFLGQLSGIVDEESKLGKALFLFNQGLAIAEIWVNVAKANAIATAASPLTFGQPWVAVNTIQGVASTAMVAAQTVAKFAKGGYTEGEQVYVAGEAGTEWIAPNWMMNNPATAQIIDHLESLRTNKVSVNQTAIPQFAQGGFTSTEEPEYNSTNDTSKDDRYLEVMDSLTQEIAELRKYRPTLSLTTLEQEQANLNNIKISHGL